jgi:hypothetical protein
MRVHVNAAGKHKVIGRVDYVRGIFDGQLRADGHDFVAGDANVGSGRVRSGNHRAVPNDCVKTHSLAST